METETIYLIYGKESGKMKTFKAMDWNGGAFVGNLIHATIIDDSELEHAKDVLTRAKAKNPDFSYQIRQAGEFGGRIVFEV